MSNRQRSVPVVPAAPVQQGMGFFQWIALMIVAVGLVVGLFYIFESLGAKTNSPFVKALTKILGSLVTVFATYFLVNRALRLRERQSDTVISSFAGYIDYQIRLFRGLYDGGPEDDEDTEKVLTAVNRFEDYEEIMDYARRRGVNAQSLPSFLLDTLCWPSYMATAEERLVDIYDATRQITILSGVATPKLAIDAIKIVDEYSDLYRDDLPVIRRGLRAYRKLEWIAQYVNQTQDPAYLQYMQEDIVESVAAAIEAIKYVFVKVPDSLEHQMRTPLNTFRGNIHSRYHEAYDLEVANVEADLEVLDID